MSTEAQISNRQTCRQTCRPTTLTRHTEQIRQSDRQMELPYAQFCTNCWNNEYFVMPSCYEKFTSNPCLAINRLFINTISTKSIDEKIEKERKEINHQKKFPTS